MASNISKAKVSVAAPKKVNHDVSSTHLTTHGFMQFSPVYAREIAPNTHIHDVHKSFMRADPLDVPTLGSFKVHNRAFFVPFRTVWEPFMSFFNDVPYNTDTFNGIIPNVPRVSMKELSDLFVLYGSVTGTATSYDFYIGTNYYTFTSRGRQWFKMLRSLGYNFVPGAPATGETEFYFSALPILCVAKVYIDYYFPRCYAHSQVYTDIEAILRRQVTYDLTSAELLDIFANIYVTPYESDIFTTSWDRPVGPNSGVGSVDYVIDDVTYTHNTGAVVGNGSPLSSQVNGTPVIARNPVSSYSSLANLTQYNFDALAALNDYVKRHQLAGSMNFSRALAQFGVSLTVEKLKRCYYLGSDDYPVQIGDVMSTAATTDAQLGAYAGKAIGYSEGHAFDFDTDEFGYYIVINSIVPDVCLPDGYDYNLLHLSRLDFFNPEFDMLGVRVQQRGELIGSYTYVPANARTLYRAPFGFVPRYAEYRVGRDVVSGDFVCNSVNGGLQGWSTQRLLDYSLGGDAWTLVHSLDFMLGFDAWQYNRIFGVVKADVIADVFKAVHSDNVVLSAPMKHLYDTYDFEDEEHHSSVMLDNGGPQVS